MLQVITNLLICQKKMLGEASQSRNLGVDKVSFKAFKNNTNGESRCCVCFSFFADDEGVAFFVLNGC